MKRLFNSLVALLFLVIFFGCSDSQPVEPMSTAQPLLKGGVPADGNGNKYVESGEYGWEVDCGEINAHAVYWFQYKVFGGRNNRNVDLAVFHFVITYTNENGDKFVWHDVGPDHHYMVGDELFVSIAGRSTASGNILRTDINVGRVVLKYDEEGDDVVEVVFEAGRNLGPVDDLACSELNIP